MSYIYKFEEHPEYAKLHAEATQEMEELVRKLRLAEEDN